MTASGDNRQFSAIKRSPGSNTAVTCNPNPSQSGTVRETVSLPQWKKPGWDQLLKIHHEVWRNKPKTKKFSWLPSLLAFRSLSIQASCSRSKLSNWEAVAVGQSFQPIFVVIVVEITIALLKELNHCALVWNSYLLSLFDNFAVLIENYPCWLTKKPL